MNASKKNYQPIAIAKKHWIIYILPFLFIIAGIVFLNNDQLFFKIAGSAAVFAGLFYSLRKANEKWLLTEEHLVIQKGILPAFRKYQEVPVHEIYKTYTETGKLGRFVNLASINTRRRADNCTGLRHSNIANADEFTNELQLMVQKLPSHGLNQVYELKEKGAISESEYNLIKLGHVTRQYLS